MIHDNRLGGGFYGWRGERLVEYIVDFGRGAYSYEDAPSDAWSVAGMYDHTHPDRDFVFSSMRVSP